MPCTEDASGTVIRGEHGGKSKALARPLLVATAAFAVSGAATALWFPGAAPSPAVAGVPAGSAGQAPSPGTTASAAAPTEGPRTAAPPLKQPNFARKSLQDRPKSPVG